ncbi:CPBP family intramembrane glutamic endopeptidase [Cellulomonas bogoriensis]|uniref:CPBP family intramembrane glutamic endopeptidase n=1 Tax=Cellulomonas bogoriensis TaxID=301388 RepID=UPI0012EC5D7A|nr:CPBP family intramembrane glutamic endopeptidase [Cellulomonas bogoriensis]
MPAPTPALHESPPRLSWSLLPAAGVSFAAFLLFGAHVRPAGYLVLVAALVGAFVVDRVLGKDLLLIGVGLTLVSTTSMEADVSWPRFFAIGAALTAGVTAPFLIDRFVYRRKVIRFPWRTGEPWPRIEKAYLVLVPLLGWALLPFYFISSGAYQNWPEVTEAGELGRFFVGVNAVGIWDELFFICTCFVLLRRHMRVWQANVLQAVIFVSFLWELGYREWGPLLTVPFALLQGYIFTRTGSLTYVIIVHLLFDAVVFLAIVHAHNPHMFPFFAY